MLNYRTRTFQFQRAENTDAAERKVARHEADLVRTDPNAKSAAKKSSRQKSHLPSSRDRNCNRVRCTTSLKALKQVCNRTEGH